MPGVKPNAWRPAAQRRFVRLLAVRTLLWILGLGGVWAALTVAMNLPRGRRLRKLAGERAGGDAFLAVREAVPDVPEGVLREVYRRVQDLVPGAVFPIRADDDLLATLEVDQGSLSDLIEELVAAPADSNDRPQVSVPVSTFAEMARLIWRYRKDRGD